MTLARRASFQGAENTDIPEILKNIKLKKITHVALTNNNFDAKGFTSLFEILADTSSIVSLDLSHSENLNSDSIKMLKEVLINNPSIKEVSLASTKLKSEHILELTSGDKPFTLTDIDLSGNSLIPTSSSMLAKLCR